MYIEKFYNLDKKQNKINKQNFIVHNKETIEFENIYLSISIVT